jgi:hypothetical protein
MARAQAVAKSQPRIGQGIRRVCRDGLAEIFQTSANAFSGSLIQIKGPPEIGLVHLRIHWARARQTFLLFGCHGDIDPLRDG